MIVFVVDNQAQQQPTDIAGVSFVQNTLKNDSLNGKNAQLEAFVLIPFLRNDKNTLGAKLNYSHGSFRGLNPKLNHTLTAADLSLFWIRNLNTRDKFQAFLQYGIFSDFKDISMDDFRFRVTGNFSRKYTDRLTLGLGMMYNRQFNSNMFVPFASLEVKVTPKLIVGGLAPIKPKITYLINNKSRWITEFIGHAETYRMSKKNHMNSVLEFTGWTGMSTIDYILKKHHRFTLGLGYTLSQRIRYYENPQIPKLKLYNFDLSEKDKPTVDVTTSGVRLIAGYSFVF